MHWCIAIREMVKKCSYILSYGRHICYHFDIKTCADHKKLGTCMKLGTYVQMGAHVKLGAYVKRYEFLE